nr:IPT/TIG domain-containing protein [Bacteroidales bacterium]
SCDEDKDLDTNQMEGGKVALNSFGPSPAMRGGELRFIGTNLDKVTSIDILGATGITEITKASTHEIRIVIPQTAEPGNIILHTNDGEMTTTTPITYSEPISISAFSPKTAKAGATITIEGDYLNIAEEIIFSNEVHVLKENFVSQSREAIEVMLPAEAQTGKIIVSDGADLFSDGENIPSWIYSEEILSATLPAVSSMLTFENKKPGGVIEIAGTNMDLVSLVKLPSDSIVEFTFVDGKISLDLPFDIKDGEIVFIPASGVHVTVANLTIAVPEDLTVSPAIGIKSTDEITISGTNIELVTTVMFPGVEEAVTPVSTTPTEIKVTVPEGTISGDLTLNTASGKSVIVAISTLKPTISAYNPNPVAAGAMIEIQGENLDLVVSITFGGDKTVELTNPAVDKFSVEVPVDAETGAVTLTMANGETTVGDELTVDKPEFCFIPMLPAEELEAGALLSVKISNGDKLTGVQISGSDAQYILQDTALHVMIPNNANGSTILKLISSNGEVEYTISVIGTSGPVETEVYTGPLELTWGDGGRVFVPISGFEGVSAGSVMKIYFVQNDNWGQAQINNGAWATLSFAELGDDGYLKTDLYNDKTVSEQELVLTQEILDNILTNAGDGNGLVFQGSDWIIGKITIITTSSESSDESIWTGLTVMPDDWSGNIQLTDVNLFASAEVGDIIRVKATDVL